MKKLFFIPAVLLVLVMFVLVNVDSATSKEQNASYYTLLGFKEKGTANPVSNVVGCLGPYEFNTGSHSYVYLWNIPAGYYSFCGDGENGFHAYGQIYVNNYSEPHIIDMEVNGLDCNCSED